MHVEMRAVRMVHPYAGNPRRNKEAIAVVARSIKEFGFRQPIVVDAEGIVIVGHTRLEAALALGMEQVPVHVAEGLTDDQARAYRLMDNKSNENAEWDERLLAIELGDLAASGIDLALTGFDSAELEQLLGSLGDVAPDPDEAPALPASARSRPGDVWILGGHRVVCGDATTVDAYGLAMDGHLADVVWTDPPYNVQYVGKTADALTIENDRQSASAFAAFLEGAFGALTARLKKGGAIYVAHADTEGLAFRSAFIAAGLKLSGCLIWRKDQFVMGRSDYQWQHEPILYGWRPGASHHWYAGRKQTTVADLGVEVFLPRDDGRWQIRIGDRILIVDGNAHVEEAVSGLLCEVRPKRSTLHPTMKPVALIERMLRCSAVPGQLILDPFGGSGSTLIAADRLGMRAALIEIDPRYVDVIVSRWQQYAGAVAHRSSDGVQFDRVQLQSAAA